MRKTLFAIVAAAAVQGAAAATTVPFVFASGDTAKASDVNADFAALATAIDALAARVTKLEGTFASTDLDGAVYALHRMQVGYGNPNSTVTNHDSYTGTVTLGAGGANLSMTQNDIYYTNGNQAANYSKTVTNGTYTGTWSLTGQVLTLTFSVGGNSVPVQVSCMSGGRLCVGNNTNDSSGSVELFVMLRTN